MKYRAVPSTPLRVSEIGFGLWTLSTGKWGRFTDGEATSLLHRAFDLGITLYDSADTYGHGAGDELLAKAFPGPRRDEIVISTKVGYDIDGYGIDRAGQREMQQDFSPTFIRQAAERALRRLHTDRIDVLCLHNIGAAQVSDDALWDLLDALKREGKALQTGVTLGPGLGWLYEGVDCIQRRNPAILQHSYNLFDQFPGNRLFAATYARLPEPEANAEELPEFVHGAMADKTAFETSFFIRGPHSSGLLEDLFTDKTVFPPEDPRSQLPQSWLVDGLKKGRTLNFLIGKETGRTLPQAALLWILAEKTVAAVLPNIYDEASLRACAVVPELNPLTSDELARVADLSGRNFGIPGEKRVWQGTMKRAPER